MATLGCGQSPRWVLGGVQASARLRLARTAEACTPAIERIIYCRVELGAFVAVDGPLVVRSVVPLVVVVERVDAGQLVLPPVAELPVVFHLWPVGRVAPQVDAEPQDAEPQQAQRMMHRSHLPSPAEAVVWKQPDYLPPRVTEPLVPPVWFAEQPQDLLRELLRRHLSVAEQPFASARWRRLPVRKNPIQAPDRHQDPETCLQDCRLPGCSLPAPKTLAPSRSPGSLAVCSVSA